MSGGPWEEEGRGKGSWLWRVRIYGWVSGREQRILTACDWRCQHRGNTQNKKNLWNKIYRSLEGRLKEQQNQQRCQQHHFWAWDPSIFIYFFFSFPGEPLGSPGWGAVRMLGGWEVGLPCPCSPYRHSASPQKLPKESFQLIAPPMKTAVGLGSGTLRLSCSLATPWLGHLWQMTEPLWVSLSPRNSLALQ